MLDTEEDQSKIDEKFDELTERGFSPDEIAEMEKSAVEGAEFDKSTSEEKEEATKIGSQSTTDNFFRNETEKNEGKGRFRAFASRNRSKATIGLVAILLGGGGFGLFSMLAGPLQFVQIAKLLQGFHFTNQEDLSDDRMMKIARYIHYNKNPEKLRLGVLGNKYADSLERKIKKSGLETGYTDNLGYFDGYIIDPNNLPPGSDLEKIHASGGEDLKQKLATHYDVPIDNITVVDGKVKVSAEGLGYFKSKKLIRVSLEDAGYSKIGSAIRSRIMGKRGGLDWHPIKKLDKKVLTTLDARLKKWAADRENRIANGAESPTDLSSKPPAEGDTTPTTDSPDVSIDDAAASANTASSVDIDGNPVPAGSVDAEVGAVKSKLGKAGAVSAVVGIICLAKSISENNDSIKQSNVVLPLMRLGGEGLSVGNQLMTGQDIDIEQLGALSKKLYSDEEGSWASARSIQAELGKELTGPDIGSEAQISNDRNAVSEVLNNIPGVSGMCTVANSIIGQIVTTGIDLVSGPFSAAASAALGTVLGPKVIDAFARWVAGHPININVAGANYGNYINYGARLAANDSIIASGGVELSPRASYELKKHRIESENEQLQNKGLLARLFDPTDTRSIVGDFVSKQSPDPTRNISRAASAIPSSMASILKLPFLSTGKAKALSANYDYGFPEYGFSLSEINNESIKNPFENEKEVVAILKSPSGNEYRTRAAGCFGVNIQSDGSVRSVGKVPAYYEIKDKNCGDTSLAWLRIRFFILDSQLMEAYACYENDTTACGEFGLDGSGNTNGSGVTGVSIADLTGPVIPCQGNPRNIKRSGAGVDWSGITPTGSIGKNSAGQDINVYVRDACAGQSKVRTIVIGATIHAGGESGGQVVAHELLFNKQLPSDVRVVAIPVINGSGFSGQSVSSRLNKNKVNLNRNFDYNWDKADESIRDGSGISPGGNYKGPSPASEPETQAIQNFLLRLGKTSLVISYHSPTDSVLDSGPKRSVSTKIGRKYAELTGQRHSSEGGAGFFEAWYNAKTETPALLVELSEDKSFEYLNKHADAVMGVLSENVVE